MACAHETCVCQIKGCGLTHPARWKPAMTIVVNTTEVGGDDVADCFAHYLILMGYPTDQPDHLRGIAERMAARRERK